LSSGEIPSELGELTLLKNLDLSNNRLTGLIPSELGWVDLLTRFVWLYFNSLIREIPSKLRELTLLTALWIYGNPLSGEIPIELANLSNLEELTLYTNTILTGNLDNIFCNCTIPIPSFRADCGLSKVYQEIICTCCMGCCLSNGDMCNDQQT
jgi:Leucine-rich repeat (LRR) protein